jgi:peptidoglycan/LPS O-acetylase OafA/YrhL
MAGMRRFWEYGLLVTVAMAVGLVVAAVVELAMAGSTDAVTGAGDLAAMVIPGAAGLVAIVLTLDAGLRRLTRSRAKAGW